MTDLAGSARPERLITARDVADRLAVSPETVLRWTRRGELPAVRMPGGAIRYRPDELEAWLDERATSTSAADRGCQTPERTALVGRHPTRRRPDGVLSEASDARPLVAATTEEEHDAR